VPAVAVIRERRVLSGFARCKGKVGGFVSPCLKQSTQSVECYGYYIALNPEGVSGMTSGGVKSVDIG